MATITIRNAEVLKVYAGKGANVATTTTDDRGFERTNYYKVWTTEPLTEGEIIDVMGDLSVRVEDFTGRDGNPKQVAAIHVNNPKIKKADAPF
jgi:hypothetical protein